MNILKKLSSIIASLGLIFALALSVVSIPTFAQLTPNTCPKSGCPAIDVGSVRINSREDIARFIIRVANLLTYIVVALAVLMIVYGAFLMIIGKADVGWTILKNCILGIIVAILAYTVVNFLSQTLQGNLFSLTDLGF
jgi:Type IV secretion system pilin